MLTNMIVIVSHAIAAILFPHDCAVAQLHPPKRSQSHLSPIGFNFVGLHRGNAKDIHFVALTVFLHSAIATNFPTVSFPTAFD